MVRWTLYSFNLFIIIIFFWLISQICKLKKTPDIIRFPFWTPENRKINSSTWFWGSGTGGRRPKWMNGTLARATDAEYIIKIAWTGSQSNIAGQDSWVARVVVIDKTVFACMDSLIWGLINLLIPDVHTLQEKLMIMTEWNLGQNVWFLKAKTICLMWHNSVKKGNNFCYFSNQISSVHILLFPCSVRTWFRI